GGGDGLIGDVGEVLHIFHGIAAIFQVAPDDIVRHEQARVAQVGFILGGEAADVHAHRQGNRFKGLFAPRKGIGDLHRVDAPVYEVVEMKRSANGNDARTCATG